MEREEGWRKRDWERSAEPAGAEERSKRRRFVIQEHHASHLHYDLRLEMDGVMKSWAVPKGPSFNPNAKRLAVHVEDHSISYMYFEGRIPKGSYGAGEVAIWDIGEYALAVGIHPGAEHAKGALQLEFFGRTMRGRFALVQMRGSGKPNQWLLIKERDEYADPHWVLTRALPR